MMFGKDVVHSVAAEVLREGPVTGEIVSAVISLVSALAGAIVVFHFNRASAREQRMANARMKELLNLLDAVGECIQALKLVRSGTVAMAMPENLREAKEADRECARVVQTLNDQEDVIRRLENRVRLLCSKTTVEAFEELREAIRGYHTQMAFEADGTGKMSAANIGLPVQPRGLL